MTLEELIKYILVLPKDQRETIMRVMSEEKVYDAEGQYFSNNLAGSSQWKEIQAREDELIKEEKTCLICFEDHIQSFN